MYLINYVSCVSLRQRYHTISIVNTAMRRIKRANVRFISLVPRGANQLPVIYKSEDAQGNNLEISLLTKAAASFDEDGVIYACVYSPELRDSQGDIADATVIKEMAYDAMKQGVEIDIRHGEKPVTKDQAHIAESFIIQTGDPRFSGMMTYNGTPVDVTGGWGVAIKVDDPILRKGYRDKTWNGVSMGGRAQIELEKFDDELLGRLSKLIRGPLSEDTDMTKDELEAALTKSNDALAIKLAKAIADAINTVPAKKDGETAPVKKTEVPALKSDATIEEIKKYRVQIAKASIFDKTDWSDSVAADNALDQLTALEKTLESSDGKDGLKPAEIAAGIKKEDPAEVRRLKIENHRLRKGSNQGGSTIQESPDEDGATSDLSKEDVDLLKRGAAAADFIQGRKPVGK